MGHVARAQRRLRKDLEVTYIVATDPGVHRRGRVKQVHASAQLDQEHGHAVRIRVDIRKEDLSDPRPCRLLMTPPSERLAVWLRLALRRSSSKAYRRSGR